MKIAIIGAGAAGLAAAYDLSKAGHTVDIYEAGPEVGGLAAGFKDDEWDWYLEKFYHHWFSNDDDILDLLKELGLGDGIKFFSPVTSLWHKERIIPLDRPVAGSALLSRAVNILSIKEIPLLDRLRFGLLGFYLTKVPNGIKLERLTANEWSRKWVGKAAHDLIWRPMLIGKFGPHYEQVNMAWLWARVYKRTAELGTYVGGFQKALDDIAAQLTHRAVSIHLDTPVKRIRPHKDRLSISVGQIEQLYDQVLCTAGPDILLKLVGSLPDAYRAQLDELQSTGAQVLIISLDRQLMTDGTYWLNLPAHGPEKSENPFPFLALVEHTNALEKAYYNNEHLLYLGDYLDTDHPYFLMDKDELMALYLDSLTKVNPLFDRSWIKKSWLFRAPYAQPIPKLHHSEAIPAIATPVDGLYFASMSQVYPWDRGTNYAVEIGRRTAKMMIKDAKS